MNNRFNDYSTDALTHFINPTPYDSMLQQLRMERMPRTDASATLTCSEPLNKSFTLRFTGRYEYGKLNNGINTYNKDGITKAYDILNSQLSSSLERESHRVNSGIGLEFKWKNLTVTPTLRTFWQKVNNNLATLTAPIRQEQFNVLPAFSIVFKQLNIYYDKGITLPAFTYLMPVTDNTNPYYIVKGNAALLSPQKHNISVNYYFNNTKKNLNIGLSGNGSFTQDDIIQSIVVDDKGVQTTTPVNANRSRSFSLNYNINKQYKTNPKFTMSWNFGAWYGYNRSRLLFNNENAFQNTFNINQWTGLNINFNDKFEWNPNYSIGYNFTSYTTDAFKKLTVINHYLDNEFIIRYPRHVIWETNYQYTFNSNIPAGLPKENIRWNAAVNFTMLKGESGVLKLALYDILNRSNNVWTSATRNMVTTTSNNVLGQYFMATFTYNIMALGAKKKVGGQRLFLF